MLSRKGSIIVDAIVQFNTTQPVYVSILGPEAKFRGEIVYSFCISVICAFSRCNIYLKIGKFKIANSSSPIFDVIFSICLILELSDEDYCVFNECDLRSTQCIGYAKQESYLCQCKESFEPITMYKITFCFLNIQI